MDMRFWWRNFDKQKPPDNGWMLTRYFTLTASSEGDKFHTCAGDMRWGMDVLKYHSRPDQDFIMRNSRDYRAVWWRYDPALPWHPEKDQINSGVKWWDLENFYPGTRWRYLVICDARGRMDIGYFDVEENKLKPRSKVDYTENYEPIYWSELIPCRDRW